LKRNDASQHQERGCGKRRGHRNDDEDHVRAKITWSEQDVGGGKLVVEVTVKNLKIHSKTDEQLRSDAKALAVRFARAFADTIDN
jgi:hypothetical protein